ncbi:MAG TPA: tRNA pseudouridine(55) synthase TruB [Nitrospirae bacterium]|nr:tRNA pseudouridine(55) synthase TruB [Nitrospirota bacterium]
MDFVVNLNKPSNISSHRAANEVRKILGAKKAGHAGTLDPLAEGVLLVCINEATKISRFLSGLDKEYKAVICLGQKTDTYDSEGKILRTGDISGVGLPDIEDVVRGFIGEINQIPPMFSAIKSSGKPLYKLARRGIVIERRPRKVRISDIEILDFRKPLLVLGIRCSKGTYIRSLADDIGESLGTGAHMCGLVRTRVGKFDLKDSVSIDRELIRCNGIPMDKALAGMEEIVLDDRTSSRLRNGQVVYFSSLNVLNFKSIANIDKSGFFRLKDGSGELFAIGTISDGWIKIARNLLTKPKAIF